MFSDHLHSTALLSSKQIDCHECFVKKLTLSTSFISQPLFLLFSFFLPFLYLYPSVSLSILFPWMFHFLFLHLPIDICSSLPHSLSASISFIDLLLTKLFLLLLLVLFFFHQERLRSVAANVLICDIIESELELQLHYYVHLQTNSKVGKTSYHHTSRLNSITTTFL